MIVNGGFDTWIEIATHTYDYCKDVRTRAARWEPRVILSESHVKRLAVLSLWIHCRVVYGGEENVDSLD